jgi:hypothetical protein
MRTRILMLTVALTSFILGAIVACCWWWYAYTHWMMLPREVELATRAAKDAAVLAAIRLNEPKGAIRQLETEMDGAVATLSEWEEVARPDDETRKARDRWLVAVKVYHESYPAGGDLAARVSALLANVPARNPESTCQSSICRLDDLRRAALNGKTNPVKEKADASAPAGGASPGR